MGRGRGGRAAGGAQRAAAQSHRGRSQGARGISAAARGGGTWRECRLGLALAVRAVGQAQASPLCSQLRGLGLAREGEAAEEESGKPRLPAPLPPKLAGVSSRKRKSKQPRARTCRRLGAGPPAWGTAWKRGLGALEEPRPGTPRAFPQPLQHHSHRRQLGPGRDGLCSSSSLGHGGGAVGSPGRGAPAALHTCLLGGAGPQSPAVRGGACGAVTEARGAAFRQAPGRHQRRGDVHPPSSCKPGEL